MFMNESIKLEHNKKNNFKIDKGKVNNKDKEKLSTGWKV